MESFKTKVNNPFNNLKSMFGKLDNLLSDSFLGFLALITLFLAVTPTIFMLIPSVELAFTIVENLILVIFLLEYMLSLYLSTSRVKFALGFWRILDALIILLGLLSLMPFIGDQFRHALSLRLLRFLRIALFGVKIRSVIAVDDTSTLAQDASDGNIEACKITRSEVVATSWELVKTSLKNKDEDWLVAGNISNNQLLEVASLLNVSPTHLSRLFFESQFPRIESMDKYTTLFLWLPSIIPNNQGDIPSIKRHGILLVGSDHNLIVLCRNNISLEKEILKQSAEYGEAKSTLPLMTWAFLKVVSLRYIEIIDHLEKALFQIDAKQKSLSDKVFLDTTFKLRSELTRMKSNIKHLSQAVRQLSEKPISIRGFEAPPRPIFGILFNDMDSLYDGVDDLLNNLSALVELRLNISSFQMNKVMRLLAILTTLTLIPAIAGGMLGMNILGNPWPLTLAEVSYCVAAGISLCLYIFAVKGWFR